MSVIFAFVYSLLASPLIYLAYVIGSLFNAKIKEGLIGRIGGIGRLHQFVDTVPPDKKIIFIHSSSVGEWEQSVQIVRKLKQNHANIVIIASFFSPSGFNVVKSEDIDFKFYLPFDDPFHAYFLFKYLKPAVWIISKYDVWPLLLFSAKRNHIPVVLASAELAEDSTRHRGIFGMINSLIYSHFDHILAVSEEYAQRFRLIVRNREIISVSGDARYDQIFQKALNYSAQPLIPIYANSYPTMICGSTWPADESVILPAIIDEKRAKSPCNFIIVPHETNERHICSLEAQLDAVGIRSRRFTRLNANETLSDEILIVDTVGQLARLYRQGNFAYVGGSFGSGVHNVLEPAAYGLPLMFGPRHKNSYEAKQLVKIGAADQITTIESARKVISDHISNASNCSRKGELAQSFLSANLGAAERTVDIIEPYLRK